MGIIRRAYDWLGGTFGFQNGQFVRLYLPQDTYSGKTVTPESALRTISVLRCATLISGAAASLPIDVFERVGGRRRPVSDHPVELVLDSEPNPDMSSMDFRTVMWMSFLLWGNAYAHIVRDGNRVVALWPLFPQYMEVAREEGSRDLLYKYSYPGLKTYIYRSDEILHVRWYSLDGIIGMSAVEQARQGIGLNQATEESAARFFRNGAQVSMGLEIPAQLGKQAVQNIRESFRESHGGPENAYRVAILEQGAKLVPVGVNPKDSQFLEQREFNDLQIAMLFGLPPHMVSLVSRSTSWGSGIEQQKQGFLDFTLAPLLTFHEKAYERCLLSKGERRLYIKHNLNAFLRADIKARYEAYAIGVDKGILFRNEARAYEDLDPAADQNADKLTVQSQMIPLEMAGKAAQQPQPAAPGAPNA